MNDFASNGMEQRSVLLLVAHGSRRSSGKTLATELKPARTSFCQAAMCGCALLELNEPHILDVIDELIFRQWDKQFNPSANHAFSQYPYQKRSLLLRIFLRERDRDPHSISRSLGQQSSDHRCLQSMAEGSRRAKR